MPRKTREQKERAAKRVQSIAFAPSVTYEGPKTSVIQALKPQTVQKSALFSSSELTAIRRDLTKIALLAFLAISTQVVLYWFSK